MIGWNACNAIGAVYVVTCSLFCATHYEFFVLSRLREIDWCSGWLIANWLTRFAYWLERGFGLLRGGIACGFDPNHFFKMSRALYICFCFSSA